MRNDTCIWIHGKPGSGKTTTLGAIEALYPGLQVFDSGALREHVYPMLPLTDSGRWANVRIITKLARTCLRAGRSCVVAAVTPYLLMREEIRDAIAPDGRSVFVELVGRERELWEGTRYESGATRTTHFVSSDQMTPDEIAHNVVRGALETNRPRKLFIGRWQPPHAGHFKIILDAARTGPVAVGVRDAPLDDDNPYSLDRRIRMLRDGLDGLDAIVFPMPDIDSIHYGRDPGFTVVEHPEVEGFSGTEIRRET